MKNLIPFLFIAIIVSACNLDDIRPPFDNAEFYKNHQNANWTKETAKEHLQGRWKFIYIYCCPEGKSQGWAAIDEGNFELLFEGDSVKVFANNTLEQTQYWKFDDLYDEILQLETEKFISNTFGTIYFSEDYMLFNGSPSDGSDNYFQQID